jgi:predicted MFS family arabinose efflux permease
VKTEVAVGRQAWIALGVLWFVYVLNFLDRQLLGILAKPIQDSLGVTDTQLGLITGLYFAMFYCVLAIPVGWLADRSNRVRVLSAACAVWSAATVGCGLAANYAQLVVARMTVGIGEAGGVPPSYAIISDYFPPERRGTAFGIFNLGPPVGAALGVAFGASIAAAYGWRTAFLALGAVGIVAAAVTWLVVREPKRGGLDRTPARGAAAKAGFRATAATFFSNPALVLASLAGGAAQVVTYGFGNFTVLFLMREKGMTLPDVALWYALVLGVGMSAGIFVPGWLVDRYAARSKQAYALVPAIGLALAIPFYLGFVHAPGWPMSVLMLFGLVLLIYSYLSPVVALVQLETPPNQRVMAGALFLLLINGIGLGLGPTYVGAVSDWFRPTHPEHSLQMALYTLTPFFIIASVMFLGIARLLRRAQGATAEVLA